MTGPTRQHSVRTRFLIHQTGLGRGHVYQNGVPITTYNGIDLVGRQSTVSESHPIRLIRDGTTSDVGGPFQTTKTFGSMYECAISAKAGSLSYAGNVAFIPTGLPSDLGGAMATLAAPSSTAALQALGTTAIARVAPTNPHASMAVALGEAYRDGLPHVMPATITGSHHHGPSRTGTALGDRADYARRAGDDYLNVEFGWLPLVSDVRSIAKSVMNTSELLRAYSRNANKPIHKRYDFPDQSTVTSSGQLASLLPVLTTQFYRGSSTPNQTVNEDQVKTRKTWFVGCFVYPDLIGGSDWVEDYYHKASYLYGLDLNPYTLWQLAPWTWLIDWFTNVGDIIKNVTNAAINGLVLRYGYVMETTTVTRTATGKKPIIFDAGPSINGYGYTYGGITKVRVGATPFGFGVNLSTLTPTQIAILAALGITLFL